MQRSLIAVFIVWAAAVIAGNALAVNVSWHRETGTQLLWNGRNEVLVLVGLRTDGWSGSGLAYVWEYVMAVLQIPSDIEEREAHVEVYSWDGGRFEQQRLDNTRMSSYVVHNGTLYGPMGKGFAVWEGRSFREITREAAQAVVADATAGPFSNIDGWSSRTNLLAIEPGATREHTVLVGNQNFIVVATKSASGLDKSIDVIFGGNRQRLWQISESRQIVGDPK